MNFVLFLQSLSRILKLSDEEAENLSFIDNKEREDDNPIDEARHYKHMQDKYGKKAYSTRKLAIKYGMVHNYYVRKLNLLELPEQVVHQCTTNKLSETHCIHICKLLNKVKLQRWFEKVWERIQKDWDKSQQKRYDRELKDRQGSQIRVARILYTNSKNKPTPSFV